MFEAGKSYRFKMWDPGEDEIVEYAPCEVISVELPLIKIRSEGIEEIINTASIIFVSAKEY